MKEFELKRNGWLYRFIDWFNLTPSNNLCTLCWQVLGLGIYSLVMTLALLFIIVFAMSVLIGPFIYLYFNPVDAFWEGLFLIGTVVWIVVFFGYMIFLWSKYVSLEESDNIFIAKARAAKARAAKQQFCPRVKIVH